MSFVTVDTIPITARLFWAAALRRAVFDYVLYEFTPARKAEWQHARDYIFLEYADYENGMNMEEVCALFNWDPGYIRRLTNKLTRKDIKRMEVESFKDDFAFDEVRATPASAQKWYIIGVIIPFYPRFLDEFTRTRELSVVWEEKDRYTFPKHIAWGVS